MSKMTHGTEFLDEMNRTGIEFQKQLKEYLMKPTININDVASVYSGKSNTCYCGCAGKYYYNPAHVEYSGKNRGYEVKPEEVDLKTVRRIVNKLNKNADKVTDIDKKIFTLQVGNYDYTVYLKDEKKNVDLDLTKDERKAATALIVNEFNEQYKESVVYLKLIEDSNASAFHIHFRLPDLFVNSAIYDEGNAIIYPSEAMYKAVETIAFPVKINWNNTKSIGWLAR